MKRIVFAVVAAVLAAVASEVTRRAMRRKEPLPSDPFIDLTAPEPQVVGATPMTPAG